MSTIIDYKGRVWTCDSHHKRIEQMLTDGQTKEVSSLLAILNPKKARGICKECTRLYYATPPCNR